MKILFIKFLILFTAVAQSAPAKLTPLRVDLKQLHSPEGLKLERKGVRNETVMVDGRAVVLRHHTFRFFSQRFLDEDWWHVGHLFVPAKLADKAKGCLFLVSHVANERKYPGVLVEGYGRQTAATVGVPVVVLKPNPVKDEFTRRTGLRKESEWQEATFTRFRKTGDANTASFAGIMRAKWRALAAAEVVLGKKVDRIVLAGGSKAGAAVRAMMKLDPRIKSVVSSGSIPFGTPAMIRKLAAKEPLAPFLVEQFKLKPADFAKDTILFNLGSNDYNAHPTSAREVMAGLRGDTRIYVHPNGGHPAHTPPQVGAMRLWLRHVFFGDKLPDVRPPIVKPQKYSIDFRAVIQQPAGVEAVELCHAFYTERPWPGPASKQPMPHKNAVWKTTPMPRRDGQYAATLKTEGTDLARLHYFVRARVKTGHVTGWLSCPVQLFEDKK
jgi:hypothetical protein